MVPNRAKYVNTELIISAYAERSCPLKRIANLPTAICKFANGKSDEARPNLKTVLVYTRE